MTFDGRCVHGVPLSVPMIRGECPACQTDPGDAPKLKKERDHLSVTSPQRTLAESPEAEPGPALA